jgi:hypothetical protein
VSQAEAVVEQTKVEIRRLQVDALAAGEVLQVNVRPGEFLSTNADRPPIVLGGTSTLHLRVYIDEYDIPRFDPRALAQASVFGQTSDYIPLEFVRIEPMVVPKVDLAGLDREKVDTRVLQTIYRINSIHRNGLFVGQQLDVFIEAVVGQSEDDMAPSASSDAE